MKKTVKVVRIARNEKQGIYIFMYKGDNDSEVCATSNLSKIENEKIFSEVGNMSSAKNNEPGSFELLCEIEKKETETVVTKIISLKPCP